MALVISAKPISGFETAFKSAWADANDDGVGIYWRDEKAERHLARIPDSADLAKVSGTYDRMLIHFRKSTKGDGTHPFSCKHRPEFNSRDWLLAHNGCVADLSARAALLKTHADFSTEIDSEIFSHIWGDIAETDPLERAKKFNQAVADLKITGWANLLFYNVVTDEWVAMSDGSLGVVSTKDTIVICSDSAWLDIDEAMKRHIHIEELKAGSIAYGRGVEFKTKKEIWKIQPQSFGGQGSYSDYDPNFGMLGMGCVTDKQPSQIKRDITYLGVDGSKLHWDKKMRAFVNEKGVAEKADFEMYGKPLEHNFTPSPFVDENNIPLCDICLMGRAFHYGPNEMPDEENIIDWYNKLAGDSGYSTTSRVSESKWNGKHVFTRDPNRNNCITCMCGSVTGFGTLHLAHPFVPLVTQANHKTAYCATCGNEDNIGNHLAETPNTHYFSALKVEKTSPDGVKYYAESTLCGRCGFIESQHTMTYTPPKKTGQTAPTIGIERMKPTGCQCNLATRPTPTVCRPHWVAGWHWVDDEGNLIRKREVAFDSGSPA